MKKLLCYFLLTLHVSTFAQNPIPIVQNMDAKDISYISYLSLNKNQYISFADEQIKQILTQPINSKIRHLYLKAQNSYFEKKFYKAKNYFLQLIFVITFTKSYLSLLNFFTLPVLFFSPIAFSFSFLDNSFIVTGVSFVTLLVGRYISPFFLYPLPPL